MSMPSLSPALAPQHWRVCTLQMSDGVTVRYLYAECLRNAECGMHNAECGMRNVECTMRLHNVGLV